MIQPLLLVYSTQLAEGLAPCLPFSGLYNNHVNTYGKICDWHGYYLIPLAFDTLGRMHRIRP